jgi:hypothetical protein
MIGIGIFIGNGGAESGHLHIKLAIADKTFANLVLAEEGNKL